MTRTLPLLLLLTACAEAPSVYEPASDAEVDDTDAPAACAARIVRIDPPEGAEVPRYVPVVMHLDVPAPFGAPWSLTVDGLQGEAFWSEDRRACTFLPEAPLAPEVTYTVRGEVCGDALTSTFRTGPAPVQPEALVGAAWGIRADDLIWHAPRSADLLTPLLVAVGVELVVDEGPMGLSLFAASDDPCEPLRLLGPLDLTANPAFTVGPLTIDERDDQGALRATDVRISGRFAAGGRELRELGVTAALDLAALGDLLPGIDACAVSRAMGEPCGPCGDGRDTCVPVAISGAPLRANDGVPPRNDCAAYGER